MSQLDLPYIIDWFKSLQDHICIELELMDDSGRFHEDIYVREEGGGGRSRVLIGQHIEKGGVMFSAVNGQMPAALASGLNMQLGHFEATGVSIVLHAKNPFVPIIHMNVRYFESEDGRWWFGGGIDVTPHYIDTDQASAFHHILKRSCDKLDIDAYHKYKKWADEYFYIEHRKETRGVGGIFFDRLNEKSGHSKQKCWQFVQDVGQSFIECYQTVFRPNFLKDYDDRHIAWQALRRGRYVEFNLVYDRGTKFGLKTNGRIESILVSMPPQAGWVYNAIPEEGSLEAETLGLLKKDIDWLGYRTSGTF